jgi:hypothetical protein
LVTALALVMAMGTDRHGFMFDSGQTGSIPYRLSKSTEKVHHETANPIHGISRRQRALASGQCPFQSHTVSIAI